MKVRIYKRMLNGCETIDSYSIVFKLPKRLENEPDLIGNFYACNVYNERLVGSWHDLPKGAIINKTYHLGKRQRLEDVPEIMRKWALERQIIWDECCESGNWDKWMNEA